MKTKQKALSPIVATILLVVVSVVLVTITLSWGRGFTNKGLEGSNTILKETTNNYMIGSPKLNAQGVLSFKNITPGDKPITITGYKIISSSEDSNFNTFLDIEDTTVPSGGTHIISIPAFPPEQKVTIQLITDQNEYISIGSIQNIPEEQQDIPEPEPEPQQYVAGPFSPGTVVNDATIGDRQWYFLDNTKVSDNNYSDTSPFSDNITDYSIKIIKSDGSFGSENKADTINSWPVIDTLFSYGADDDLWAENMTYAQINNSNFGVVISAQSTYGLYTNNLKATNFNFQIPENATINGVLVEIEKKVYADYEYGVEIYPQIDHIRMTVYYTN